jgi:FAD/FMN-containing dehydrogenase
MDPAVTQRDRVDRRAFLRGVAGVALLAAGCGGGGSEAPTTSRPRTVAKPTPPKPPPKPPPLRLSDAVRGPVITPRDPRFLEAALVYNQQFDGVRPRAVVVPLDAEDVRQAVRWAVARGIRVVARSGGHSYAGYSTIEDGIVLDLRRLRGLWVERRSRTATVGAGTRLIDLYAGLARHGATVPGGSCPSVGVSGLTLGGGMGLAGRAFGLTCDNLVAARIVTADGRLREAAERDDPDLLWALRGGGGGNFGVVTSFTYRVHRIPRAASWFIVSWPWSSASEALSVWERWAPHARDDVTSILHLNGGASPSVQLSGQLLGAVGELDGLVAPLRSVPGAQVSAGAQDYLGLQLRWAGCLGRPIAACHTVDAHVGGQLPRADFRAKSDYVDRPLSSRGRAALLGAVEERAGRPGSAAILLDSYGGAINRVRPDATAFVHRDQLYAIQYLAYGDPTWPASARQAMRPFVSGHAYQNYIDADLRSWRHAYYGRNYRRLVGTQRRVDPDHFFRFPQAVGA